MEEPEKSLTIWLTGKPCSGKTSIGKKLNKILKESGYNTIHLDGDNVRKGINSDLGFSENDRKENLRRIAHIARLFNENNNIVIASFVSPTNEMRKMIREIIGEENFKLVYLDCCLEECEKRDVKGMYKKAREGEIRGFTGLDSVFEIPKKTDLVLDTEKKSLNECVQEILSEVFGIEIYDIMSIDTKRT